MTQNKHQQYSDIKWHEVIFYAEAIKESFRGARVITAQSKYVDIAYDIALNQLNYMDDVKNLDGAVARIINAQTHSVREYVDVGRDGFLVCINAPVIDELVTLRSLDLVAEALKQLNGNMGKIYFGDKLTFTTKDIPWLFKH